MAPKRPAETALTFVSAITGWHLQQASFRAVSREETEAFAEHLVALFMAGRSAW